MSTKKSSQEAEFELAQSRLIEEIDKEIAATQRYTGIAKLSPNVRNALHAVPRHAFIPEYQRSAAYANMPLPIGDGQTISQPYIVALMTELLQVDQHSKVLEVGTGSGYQAAVLAQLVEHVYSIEVIPNLAAQAKARFAALGIDNITVREGDGHLGWPEQAPFDAIIATAAAKTVPPALIEQLKPQGRLVIPVGEHWGPQMLKLIIKTADTHTTEKDILPVAFVPMTHGDQTH